MRPEWWSEFLEGPGSFMSFDSDWDSATEVFFGVPMDFTASFRPGSRMGPQRLREVSYGIEEYSMPLDRDLRDIKVHDLGDIIIPFGNVPRSLQQIEKVAKAVVDEGKRSWAIGGEHLVSLPLIKAVRQRHDDLIVLHFDAHADLRYDYLGERLSHATVMRRVSEMFHDGKKHIYQFGIRSGTKEEREYAKEHTHCFFGEVFEPLKQVAHEFKGKPVYISIDIDVVDPAFAPGTGTPEPGGITSKELFQAIHYLKDEEINLVGFDLVEILPHQDASERTTILGAKIIREALLAFSPKKGA